MFSSANQQRFPAGNLPRFNKAALPQSFFRPISHETIDQHKTLRRRHNRKTLDARHLESIVSAIPTLPNQGESWHIITRGNTPLWLVLPRLLELCSEPIAELKISTLGFGRDFARYLIRETASGAIRDYGIVCSHYFRSTSEGEYEILVRAAGRRLAVVRCHAKVIAATMQDGRSFVIEGSGNLRSCRSIEQMVIVQDAELARFHQSWITELLNGAPPDSAIRPIGDDVAAGRGATAAADRPE